MGRGSSEEGRKERERERGEGRVEREREREKCGEEEICGEIIIPGVTVATFCEVDVDKILSHTIHFNFTSKKEKRKMLQRETCVCLCVDVRRVTQTHTHARVFLPSKSEGGGLATCAAYRLGLGSTSSPVVI